MEFFLDYLNEQRKCIVENSDYYYAGKLDIPTQKRLEILRNFCFDKSSILSVGCSGYEPIFLNSSHALDIDQLSERYLRHHGWKGEFFLGSCDSLPFPEKYFDCAVCSEVIEHLPNLEIIKKTFLEVDRVSKSWIFTTPSVDKIAKKWQYPGHLQFWGEKEILEILKSVFSPEQLNKIKISTHAIFIIIEKK